MNKKHIVIIGGGFGGLYLAKGLRNAPVEITLIDRTNHHLFQPMLYQVASGALSPADIATPLRQTFARQTNIHIRMDEATRIERPARRVHLATGESLTYDQLVVAVGNQPSYFGNDHWRRLAPGLKDLTDALDIRDNLYRTFETASRLPLPADRAPWLTFVIVGGGPTGVELAGAFAEIAMRTLRADFRNLGPDEIRIVLVEGGSRLLAGFDESLSASALADLERIGVQVRLNTLVTDVTDVTESSIQLGETTLPTHNIVWAAGNQASPLLATLVADTDRVGRVFVEADLSLRDDPDVFVIGDAAHVVGADGQPLPGVCPVAVQQGEYLAALLPKNLPKAKRPPFHYFDKGILATIGRASAVAQIGSLRFSGLLAWLLWCFIHIYFLIGFRNRLRVMIEWIWFYITFRPGVRLLYRHRGRQLLAS